MLKLGDFIMNTIYVIYMILFLIVCIGTFGMYVVTEPLSIPTGIVIFIVGITALIAIKNSKHKFSNRKFIVILAILMILMFLVQLYFAYMLKMEPISDRQVILNQALDMVNRGVLHTSKRWNNYFVRYPNNTMILLFETAYLYIVKLLGFGRDYLMSLSILNIICIDISVILTIALCKNIYGKRSAMFLAIFCVIFMPFYIYVPFFYTDTLVLPIVAGILYLYQLLLKKEDAISVSLIIIALVLLLSFGYMLKATVMILFIALSIHIFFIKSLRRSFIYLGIMTIMIFTTITFTNRTITNMNIFDETNYNTSNFPYTHWVMMGLNGIGNYQLSEREFTSSFKTKAEKQEANINAIKAQLKEYGSIGFTAHIVIKSVYTWYSGQYDMDYYLETNQTQDNWIKTLVYHSGSNHVVFASFSDGIHLCILISILCCGISCFKQRQKDFNLFIKLGVLGLFSFLLIWETRPRYLVQFMPLILLTSFQGWNFIADKIISKPPNGVPLIDNIRTQLGTKGLSQ